MMTKRSTRTAELAATVIQGRDYGPVTDTNERREGAARDRASNRLGRGRPDHGRLHGRARGADRPGRGNQGFARTFVGLAELNGQLLIRLSAAEPAMIVMGELAAPTLTASSRSSGGSHFSP
jgi:hypothetical protein